MEKRSRGIQGRRRRATKNPGEEERVGESTRMVGFVQGSWGSIVGDACTVKRVGEYM